jgi:capsular exopolysaccharide synthesis family protein
MMGDRHGPTSLHDLATIAAPTSPAAEAYRTVGVNLRYGGVEPRPKTILFTSAGRDDDRSIAITNVAVAAAQSNAQVVLVDGDLRHPTLHEVFGVANGQGLTTVRDGTPDDVVIRTTEIGGLKLVTSGPPPINPSEVLSSPTVAKFIERLRADADLVLVDAAPIMSAADTSVLAATLEGVILVVDGKRTRRQDARRAKEQLERVNARILGVLLHNARMDSEG